MSCTSDQTTSYTIIYRCLGVIMLPEGQQRPSIAGARKPCGSIGRTIALATMTTDTTNGIFEKIGRGLQVWSKRNGFRSQILRSTDVMWWESTHLH